MFPFLACNAGGATLDGALASPLARHRALEADDAVGETIVALKSSDDYIIMVGLSRAHKLQPKQASESVTTRPVEGLAVGLVSLPLDKLRTTQIMRESILDHFKETSESIPVGLLAVKLADEIHREIGWAPLWSSMLCL